MNVSSSRQPQRNAWTLGQLNTLQTRITSNTDPHLQNSVQPGVLNQPRNRMLSLLNIRQCCSSSLLEGLIVGALVSAIAFAVLVTLWLTSASKNTTTVQPASVDSSLTSTVISVVTSFVFEWNSTGITAAGITSSCGTAVNQLCNPFGVAVDSANTLFIADRGNNRIQKMFQNGSNATTVAGQSNGISGSGLNYLNNPSHVNIDSSDNIYVTEIYNYRVLFWPSGAFSGTLVAGNGTAGSLNNLLNEPHDIAHDWNTGTLYISDFSNHRVMKYLSGASSGSVVVGGNGPGYNNTQLLNPTGLYFDSSSNSLFIANYGAHNIVCWVVGASSWTLVAGIGGSIGSSSTLLYYPGDVTLDSMGNVYVADTFNHRIQFFWAGQSNGSTIAGITSSPGSTSTQLNTPFGLSVDAQFNVYVADYANHRIQKFIHY